MTRYFSNADRRAAADRRSLGKKLLEAEIAKIMASRATIKDVDEAMEPVIEKALDERQEVTERDLRAAHFTRDQIKARFTFCVARVLERRPDLRHCINQAA